MAQDNAGRSSSGRSALGGAACGFTFDGALQDAVAREDRLRRPLRLKRWQEDRHRLWAAEMHGERREPEPLAQSH